MLLNQVYFSKNFSLGFDMKIYKCLLAKNFKIKAMENRYFKTDNTKLLKTHLIFS